MFAVESHVATMSIRTSAELDLNEFQLPREVIAPDMGITAHGRKSVLDAQTMNDLGKWIVRSRLWDRLEIEEIDSDPHTSTGAKRLSAKDCPFEQSGVF